MKNGIKFFIITFIILNVLYIAIDLSSSGSIDWGTNLTISLLVSFFNGLMGYGKSSL